MRFSLFASIAFASLTAASVECPIVPYDARPGYNLACVRGDANGVYENELIQDIEVVGGTFNGVVSFECIRKVGE